MMSPNGRGNEVGQKLNLVRIQGCHIGGLAMEINGSPELDSFLQMFRSKMADFSWTGSSPDLVLNIFQPEALPPSCGTNADEARIKTFTPVVLQRATLSQQHWWTSQKKADLEYHLRHPEACLWLNVFSQRSSVPICVPLEEGFFFFDIKHKFSVLLLNNQPTGNNASCDLTWPFRLNITVVNAVMCFLAFWLASTDGVIAHAVGISHRGGGYVIPAVSNGGKTTLSRHSPPGAVLSDDGLIIRRQENRFMLYPTPFRQQPGGDIFKWDWCQSPVPLKGLCVLEKSDVTRLVETTRIEAMDLLLRASTHFFSWMAPELAVSVFDFWRELLKHFPIARLKWRKGDNFLMALEQLSGKEKQDENKKRTTGMAQGI